MISDSMTLYKLMILYLLHKVDFPLTNTQISDFILGHGYTNYFTLQQAISELAEAELIRVESIHNTTRYTSSEEGDNTLEFFGKQIPAAIQDDMDEFVRENRYKMRNDSSITSNFYKTPNNDYIVHMEVREGKSILYSIELTVPDQKEAENICNKWKSKSASIYKNIIKSLMSDE